MVMLREHAYLVSTRKVLDEEAEKNPSNQTTSHLQHTSQEVVPSGTLKEQQRKYTTNV